MHEAIVIQRSLRGSNNNNIPVELKVLLFQEWKYNVPVARAWSAHLTKCAARVTNLLSAQRLTNCATVDQMRSTIGQLRRHKRTYKRPSLVY